ncbi:MAG: heparinase, partial [Mesorhizobium sp.]
RFHVHPDISLLQDDHDRLTLAAAQGDSWVFTCAEVVPEVEESIYFAGLSGPRRSRQIVLAFKASEITEVHWQLTRTIIAGYPENN